VDSHNAGRGICDAGKEEKLTKKQTRQKNKALSELIERAIILT
jgi:ATP-dependent Clp protease adapter protein ClpS